MIKHPLLTSILWILPVCCLLANSAMADQANNPWGISAGYRIARIPFPTADEQVSDFIPKLYFEGDTFFLHGLSGGAKLYSYDNWRFNLLGKYRYFDIPAEYQNAIRGNGLDWGLQTVYKFDDFLEGNIDLLADDEGRSYLNLKSLYRMQSGNWELTPSVTLRWKSADFNNTYYGLDGAELPNNPGTIFVNKIGSGSDLTIGSDLRYHVISNLYIVGNLQFTTLDNNTADSPTIDKRTQGEIYLGIAFFEDSKKKSSYSRSNLRNKPYIRVAHGSATPSNVGDILFRFDSEDDPQNNKMTSVFYGHPVADSLFGIPFNIYLTPGLVYHQEADPYSVTLDPGQGINDSNAPLTITYDSQPTTEFVLAIKATYEFTWPVRWRPGLAEGLSYVKDISNIEQREMDRKGYRSSNLLNYLDFSVDVNLGDIFRSKSLDRLWLGYSLHHRSAIFETSSAFGRIKGGSNYNTLYLQYHW